MRSENEIKDELIKLNIYPDHTGNQSFVDGWISAIKWVLEDD